jgi:hypothetical protein
VEIIWETVDRLGRSVILTPAGWAHIVAGHKDMADLQDAVRIAVEDAIEVRADALRPRRDVHYAESGIGSLLIKVVVRYSPDETDGWLGEVVTAYFTRHPKRAEKPKWP